MNNFWQRAITGTLFVVVLIGAIVLGGWYMKSLFILITALGLIEFYQLFKNSESKPQVITGTILGVSLITVTFISTDHHSFLPVLGGILLLSLIGTSIVELFRDQKKPFENIGITLLGIVYISLPFILLNAMWYVPMGVVISAAIEDKFMAGFWPILTVFILIWCNDTFAYLTGRLIGKHKLFERISPKKTWEGFIGGAVFAVLGGLCIAWFTEQNFMKLVAFALTASVIGTLGDLVESMLKRSLNVKDSGKILPGHGGILDRFDAVLFATPAIFFLEKVIFA